MNRIDLTRPILALTLTLACTGVLGQMNKCVDANGKVSYQERPCQGAKPPAAAPASAKSAAAQGQAAAHREIAANAAPPMPNHAAKECAESWESLKTWTAHHRGEMDKVSDPGKRVSMQNYADGRVTDFLRPCKRVGFVALDKPERTQQNNELAAKLSADYKAAYERRMAWEAEQSAKSPPVVTVATSRSAALPPPQAGPELSVDAQATSDCAETWNISGTFRYSRREFLKDQRARGKGQSASSEADEQRRDKADGARFLAQCEKFGFIWPQDDAGEKKNSRLVDQIRAKAEGLRETRRNADAKYELDRQVERRKQRMAEDTNSRAEERRAMLADCDNQFAEMARNRNALTTMSPADRQSYGAQLDSAERDLRARCGR